MALPGRPGTYALVLRSRRSGAIQVGRLGDMEIRRGWYLYVGSAFGPGGLAARVGRHLRASGPRHWHIDHLRGWADPVEVWLACGRQRREHRWARSLGRGAVLPRPGFGASDCRCPAHLFFLRARPARSWLRRRLGHGGRPNGGHSSSLLVVPVR